MKKYLFLIFFPFLLTSCSLFKSDKTKVIELVQQTKTTELVNSQTWLDYANDMAKKEANIKHVWEAEETKEAGVFLVAFKDEKGWGARWEVTLKEKIVKYINGNDYLSMKYGLSRLDGETEFSISNITTDTLKVEADKMAQGFWESLFSNPSYKKVVVYRFEADITNNSDKYITDATINGRLKLIFKEKTIVGGSGSSSFNSSISKSKPWEPGQTKKISIRTKDIDKVYLNYTPEYSVFELNLQAEDPIGFSYDKNIWEADKSSEWKYFTETLKQSTDTTQ